MDLHLRGAPCTQVAEFLQDDQLAKFADFLAVHVEGLLQRAGRSPSGSEASDGDSAVEARALALLGAIAPHAAAAALQATPYSLADLLAALPPPLHGVALRAHCAGTTRGRPSKGLHLWLNFRSAGPLSELCLTCSEIAPALRDLPSLTALTLTCDDAADLRDTLQACSGQQQLEVLERTLCEGARLWRDIECEFAPFSLLRSLFLHVRSADGASTRRRHGAPLPYLLMAALPALEVLSCIGDVAPTPPPWRAHTAPPQLRLDALLGRPGLGHCGVDLSGLSRLRHLDLRECGLTAADVAALAAALPPLERLTRLSLACNGLGGDAHGAMAQLLVPALRRTNSQPGSCLHGVHPKHITAALDDYVELYSCYSLTRTQAA